MKIALIAATAAIIATQIGCTWWLSQRSTNINRFQIRAAIEEECEEALKLKDPRTAFFASDPRNSCAALFK